MDGAAVRGGVLGCPARGIRQGWRGAGRSPRAALGAAAVAAVLLTAACGAVPGLGRGPGGRPVAFSECMRSHGVTDWPDPEQQGFQIKETSTGTTVNGVTLREGLAQIRSAQQICQRLEGPRHGNTAPAPPREQQAALAYGQCMRSHGLPDFPDPRVTATSFMVRMPPGTNPQSPPFQAAQRACRSLISQYGG